MWYAIKKNKRADKAQFNPLGVDEYAMYRSMFGTLMYIVMETMPDQFVVGSMLSLYLHKPRAPHIKAAKRSLRYLYRACS